MRARTPAAPSEADVHAWAYENPRPEIVALVPADARRVLDLGCSSGAVGAAIKSHQEAEVVGIELNPAYAERARERLDRVIAGDLDELLAREDLAEDLGRFDCLVAGDVLEHLRDPWTALRRTASLLEPGGTAIISLPNVRHWEVLWTIGFRGTFPRRREGIFDRTHLRWFTASDGVALLEEAGLELIRIERVYTMRAVSGRWDDLARRLSRWPLRPFFVLQHILVARRPGEPTA